MGIYDNKSIFNSNPLIKRLQPKKHPSKIPYIFKNLWKRFTRNFVVEHPNPVKENLSRIVRPLESQAFSSGMTLGNLWHYYETFLSEDMECPPELKSIFQKMEKNEKELLKIQRIADPKKQNLSKKAYAQRTLQEIQNLAIGKSHLLLLTPSLSLDHSLNGQLFCTLSRTKEGFTLSFTGTGQAMSLLHKENDKVSSSLYFESIPADKFKNSPFLNLLLQDWVEPEKLDPKNILIYTESFTKKDASHEKSMASSNRADKLFWNIVLSLPKKDQSEMTRGDIKVIRLRTELLILFETFDNCRFHLDPKTKEYQDLRRLLSDVSAKALHSYRKGDLSKEDLRKIKHRLIIIEKELQKAKKKPSKIISSKTNFEPYTLQDIDLKKASLRSPHKMSQDQVPKNAPMLFDKVPYAEIEISIEEPFSLETYTSIDSSQKFIDTLKIIHSSKDRLTQGSTAERKQVCNEIFRFFYETTYSHSENLDISPSDAKEARDRIIELTQAIAKVMSAGSLNEYAVHSLFNMYNTSLYLNAFATGLWFEDELYFFDWRDRTYYKRDKRDIKIRFNHDFEEVTRGGWGGVYLYYPPDGNSPTKHSLQAPEGADRMLEHLHAIQKILHVSTHFRGKGAYQIEITDFFEKSASLDKWIRPIHNPYLRELYRKCLITYKKPPEAFFDNLEEIFNDYIQDLPITDEEKDLFCLGTLTELKHLSRILVDRDFDATTEISAFIKEHPHLLYNPEIRNFIDALIYFAKGLPKGFIEEEMRRLTAQIKEQMHQKPIEDPELLKVRFETLLYFNEQAPNEKRIKNLCLLSQKTPELKSSFGYASRILLKTLLKETTIHQNNISLILHTFADAYCSTIDPMNVEPWFEQQMELHWQKISAHLKEIQFDATPLLERICFLKGMHVGEGEWSHAGDLIFKKGPFEVDLKTFEVRLTNTPLSFGPLPGTIISDAALQPFLERENLETLIVQIEKTRSGNAYFFKDHQGMPIQIEVRNGKNILYKQFELKGKKIWLQGLDIKPKAQKKPKGLLASYTAFKKDRKKEAPLAFFDNGVFINPKTKKAYTLNTAKTKLELEMKLQICGADLRFSHVRDLRTSLPTGRWKINHAGALKSKNLDFLNAFENKEHIILWRKKGELKKIEFQRYGLTFAVKNGQLYGLTEPFIGYKVSVRPDGLRHALYLEHPNPKKPNKILLADSKALEKKEKSISPKARGLGKIALGLHYLGVVYDLVKKGIPPASVKQEIETFSNEPKELFFTAFDIRPYTGEICKTKTHWEANAFELIKHAIASDDPKLARSFLKRFSMQTAINDQKLLKDIFSFIDQESKTVEEAAFKTKMGVILLHQLAENKKLSKNKKAYLKNALKRQATVTKQKLIIPPRSMEEPMDHTLPLPIEGRTIERLPEGIPLLFREDEIQFLFNAGKKALPEIHLPRKENELPFETLALDAFQENLDTYRQEESERTFYTLKYQRKLRNRFIKKQLLPKQAKYEEALNTIQTEIEKNLQGAANTERKMASLAGEIKPITLAELRLAWVQGDLERFQKKYPNIEEHLFAYFDTLARKNAAELALDLINNMQGKDQKEWQLMSEELHRLLTIKRNYDPKLEPRLLIFEAQLFLNFKELPGGVNQLDLLEKLIADPQNLIQAPTGAGKTSVLSVLESLLKANGENLVIQKVLPPLYHQTHERTHEVVGDLFNTLVMPFRFNLKMRLTTPEIDKEKTREASIFKGLYHDLSKVIKNKGVLLTDYTSLPLLEAKYLQIGQELVECSFNNVEPTELQVEHYTYLRKILILLRHRGAESMDEFDQPNRPTQKLQLDLQMGSKEINHGLIDTTLEIYDLLIEDPDLGLLQNIQADLSKTTREEALRKAATKMAQKFSSDPALVAYFLGENQDILDRLKATPEDLDAIALCKDQFSIYLPLTLNYKQGSRYARSADGTKTVPALNGQKHDARFGTFQEQMNYTIQDYLQTGIRACDLEVWFKSFKPRWDSRTFEQQQALEEEFKELFPEFTVVECAKLLNTKEGKKTLIAVVNQDATKIRKFLKIKLQELKTSGYLISMDPLNAVDMTLTSSGISATTGAKESLHAQFHMDKEAIGRIKAQMAYRILSRSKDPEKVLPYSPENPQVLLNDTFSAVIDGAGAFNDTQATATALLNQNPELLQVAYHQEEESIVFVGKESGSLSKTGFIFDQAHTRGTDIALSPQAHALLTLSEQDGFRDLAQKEGRLRGPGQTFDLAMPQDQASGNLIEALALAECVDAHADAKDIYRHCRQEITAKLRNEALNRLLLAESVEEFVTLFQQENFNSLFITKPQPRYQKPGAYFEIHKNIKKADTAPKKPLEELHAKVLLQAINLGLNLEPIQYAPELLAKMPPLVNAMQAELECELHVEQEVEAELEEELELEMQQEVEHSVDQASKSKGIKYPFRKMTQLMHSIKDHIHSAYDPALFVSEAFLPFERNKTASKFKRLPFESSMYNVGQVFFKIKNQKCVSAMIEDPLVETWPTKMDFIYDIRLQKVIVSKANVDVDAVIRTEEFHRLIAEIKFFDGRTEGYTLDEIEALRKWLIASDPRAMQKHLLDEILLYRIKDKQAFATSQLGALFNELIG